MLLRWWVTCKGLCVARTQPISESLLQCSCNAIQLPHAQCCHCQGHENENYVYYVNMQTQTTRSRLHNDAALVLLWLFSFIVQCHDLLFSVFTHVFIQRVSGMAENASHCTH